MSQSLWLETALSQCYTDISNSDNSQKSGGFMKKNIFRIISLIIALILVIPLNASAYSYLGGDVDNDGTITASDARFVLRTSVGLEKVNQTQALIADVDFDNMITASDARLILRMSVGLEQLLQINQHPEAIRFEVHFIDVGQADCSLIICDNEALLIDGGNVGDSDIIIAYLRNLGIRTLDYVICTHAHEDHAGGLGEVLKAFTVTKAVFAPATGADTKCYNEFISAAEAQNLPITTPEAGNEITLGTSTITFIAPITENYDDINNTSIVVKITDGENSFLFTGDAERESEQDILEAGADISADVIKIGHHGSENSTTYPFLREVMPRIAVISVGENNSYGHPTEEALSRLRDAGVTVYRTDLQGHIVIKSDRKELTVTTEKNQATETNPTKPNLPEDTTTSAPPTTEAPEQASEYIGNINSKKLHIPSCSTLPKEENRIYFATVAAAITQGYTACSRCKPF